MREKQTNATIIHSVYYLCMVAPTRLGITLPSPGSVPSVFWEMLNWGSQIAIHSGTRHNPPAHTILATVPHFSITQKALGTLPEDGNVMLKHVGDTLHN
jgi:hypothetical protein